MKSIILSIFLILNSFVVFGIYIWWAIEYCQENVVGAWGAGIWLFSIILFFSGISFFIKKEE